MHKPLRNQLIGISSCLALSVLLPIMWVQWPRLWPFRLVYLDLWRWGWPWDFAAMIGANAALLVTGFELVMALKRTSLAQRRSAAATCVLSTAVFATLGALFCFYPKARGFVVAKRVLENSAEASVTYVEDSHDYPQRAVTITTRTDMDAGFILDSSVGSRVAPEHHQVLIVPEDKMLRILRHIEDEGFFEMDCILYPYGTYGGTWQWLEVSAAGRGHKVHSYAEAEQGRDFDALIASLQKKYGLEPPPKKRPQR